MNAARKKIRILLVDDHAAIRLGLRHLIINEQRDMQVVGEASDGENALSMAQEFRPDVVIMDISMPGIGGIETTARMKRLCPEVAVLIYSVHTSADYARCAIEAGAMGYLHKSGLVEELPEAIRTVSRGVVYLEPSVAEELLRKPGAVAETAMLNDKEIELLKLAAAAHTNKEISERLGMSVKAVESSKNRAMERLGLRHRRDLLQHALSNGWLRSYSSASFGAA